MCSAKRSVAIRMRLISASVSGTAVTGQQSGREHGPGSRLGARQSRVELLAVLLHFLWAGASRHVNGFGDTHRDSRERFGDLRAIPAVQGPEAGSFAVK